MSANENTLMFRIRYNEIDRMDTFYNSKALEWFEHGRTELLRELEVPYKQMEAQGVLLPVIEAHVEYLGRASYDDELRMTTSATLYGKARLRFDVEIAHAEHATPVASGYTIHAVTDPSGKPIRPPTWLTDALGASGRTNRRMS